MNIEPYLFFNGRCEEAIDFYKRALGAEVVMLMRFKESPEPPQMSLPPGAENKVMHATLRIGETNVMMSDGECKGSAHFDGFGLAVNVRDAAEAERRFGALQDGGAVTMPLGKTFFSPSFGMVRDRFGVHWMVVAAA
jgi:PhnB protein